MPAAQNLCIATCADKPNLTAGDRQLAQELENLGMRVHSAIWTDAVEKRADAIIVRSVWDYHLHIDRFRTWIQRTGIKYINPAPTILANIDKQYLFDLEAKAIPIIPSKRIQRSTPASRAVAEIQALKRTWNELVVKPTISATAHLTTRLGINDTEAVISEILKHSDLLAQPFLPSIETAGEISLIFFNPSGFSHAVLKRPKSGDFRVQSDFGGSETPFEPKALHLTLAAQAISALQLDWVFARVDLVDFEFEPKISEIELIEPDLFLQYEPQSAKRLALAIQSHLMIGNKHDKPTS